MPANREATVYIDGFNLYYGMLRPLDLKWVDLQRAFEILRPDDDLQWIHYFTARPNGDSGERHDAYVNALRSCPKVRVHMGRFKDKSKRVGLECPYCGRTSRVLLRLTEEKETDVAIGIQIVSDVLRGATGHVILVTGDTDLAPALREAKAHNEVKITVYIPAVRDFNSRERAGAKDLREVADCVKILPWDAFARGQFEATVRCGEDLVPIPPTWRIASNADIREAIARKGNAPA